MSVVIGTSGWQYKDWKDRLYRGIPQKKWLEHYASLFPSVEVNNTFYRLPNETTFATWAERTPEDFIFVVKGSRFITHLRRLRNVGDSIQLLLERARPLLPKVGAVLYQLPPNLRRDDELLKGFLDVLPASPPTALEFRHDSWYEDAVYALLRERDVALVLADGVAHKTPVRVTASWSYIRFHGEHYGGSYSDDELKTWTDRIVSMDADRVYCFFNNDRDGNAVKDARRLTALVAARGAPVMRPAAAA